MTKEEFDRHKVLEDRDHRGRKLTPEEYEWLNNAYDRLSPQQKGVIHRKWKERAEEDYIADAMVGVDW